MSVKVFVHSENIDLLRNYSMFLGGFYNRDSFGTLNMNMVSSSNLPIFSFVAVALSTIILLIAFSSSHWLVDSTATWNFGLWTTCYRELIEVPPDASGNGTVSTEYRTQCVSTHDWVNSYLEGWQSSWVGGLQATVTTAVVFCMLAFVSLVIYLCYIVGSARNRQSIRLLIIYITALAAFVSACCLLVGLVICGSQPSHEESAVTGAVISWSFELAVTADVTLWLGVILAYAEFARVNILRR